jgi:hypothetical protein
MPTSEKRLVGTWMHVHEEDTARLLVFRPADYDFLPARGRVGYEFRADHSCEDIGISPRDGSARSSCTWRLRGGSRPELVIEYPDGHSDVFSVVSVDRDRLVLRRATS